MPRLTLWHRSRTMDLINPLVRKMMDAAHNDPEAFWGEAARSVPWFRTWDKTFDWTPPTFRWFIGGQTNIACNALDYHVNQGRGGRTALIYTNERGERRTFTYAQLLYNVERVAAALRGLGVQKGDRITIYMPTMPEAIMLMLACARIGAIHLCVFAGFGSGALADRLRASGSKLVFTTDVTYRKGKDVPLKGLLDAALDMNVPSIEHAIVLRRTPLEIEMREGRDLT